MLPIRELRVVLNHHQHYQKAPLVTIPNEVKLYRRQKSRSLPENPNKQHNESKNLLINMKTEPKSSKIITPKRLTRASMKTTPPPSVDKTTGPTTRSNKKRGRPKKTSSMIIKHENSLEMKHELIYEDEENSDKETNNNIQPLKKKIKSNPVAIIDLTGSGAVEIKIDDRFQIPNLLDISEITADSSTTESVQLNDAFLDKTDSSNNETIDVSVNNENDQNMNNKKFENISMNETPAVIGDNQPFASADIEKIIKFHVITIDNNDETLSSKFPEDHEITDDIEILNSTVTQTQQNHQIRGHKESDDLSERKMKCLNEIISEVFDLKLPESEERLYFTMQHVLDEYRDEKKQKDLKREAGRKKYEKTVLSNVQGIKLMLTKMNRKKIMIDQMTQTDESSDKLLEPSSVSTKTSVNESDLKQNLKEAREDAHEEQKFENKEHPKALATVAEESQQPSDLPTHDLTGMIILDSVDATNDHQGSVFQRLGDKSPIETPKNDQQLLESPENPSPGPLKFIELQREVIERHNRESNIVITGFRCPKNRVEADVSEYLWKNMGINAGVVRVMKIGDALVVTVASHFIKKKILKRRGIVRRSSIRISSDYTGRERKVQKWLEAEEWRRKQAGENVRAAYGKILIEGVWWFWHELEGKLTRKPFRPELASMQ